MKTLQELQHELSDVMSDISVLEERLANKKETQHQLMVDVWSVETGLSVGDTVEWMEGKARKTGIISEVRISWRGVTPTVLLHKKDGSVGARKKNYWWGFRAPVKITRS